MNWLLFFQALPTLLKGCLINIEIASGSFAIGLFLSIFIALMERSSIWLIKGFALGYNILFRGTPIIIQIFFSYYILPSIGITLPPLILVILTIGLNSGAYLSQVIQSGLNSISKGQFSAAKALGMNTFQTYRYIIFPQCFRRMIPAFTNEIINLLKDSSLASVIGINEIVKTGAIIRGRTFEPFSVFLGIALIYLGMVGLLNLGIKQYERWSQKRCSA